MFFLMLAGWYSWNHSEGTEPQLFPDCQIDPGKVENDKVGFSIDL